MPRWPLASSALRFRVSRPGTPFLPKADLTRVKRVLPHLLQRHPQRNARTPHNAPLRQQIEITTCKDNSAAWTTPVSFVDSQARTGWMTPSTSQALEAFLHRYPPRGPSRPSDDPHEDHRLAPKDGLRILGPAPATDILTGAPPTSRSDSRCRYLWVIDKRGIPHIIEESLDVLNTMPPKHTNLTGGGKACM